MVTRGCVGVAHPAMTTSLTGTDLAMWQLPISMLFDSNGGSWCGQTCGRCVKLTTTGTSSTVIWASTWQNQQNECAPSEDSDQPGIRPVWSESSLFAQWVAKDPSFLHADSEDSDQTGRMPRLIWVFARRTLILLVLSCRGSYSF